MRSTLLGGRRGFALEATIFVLVLVAALCALSVLGVTAVSRTAGFDYRAARANYAAEAAADDIMQQLSTKVDDGFISQDELDSLVMPAVSGFSISNLSVTPVGGATQETVNDGPYTGLYALIRNYDIRARASDSAGNSSEAIVSVKAAAIPIFQFGVFYEKDLEVTNGPPLTFRGWVHSNGNIFIRSANSFYKNIITTPNKYLWRRKDGANPGGTDGVWIDNAAGTAVRVNNDSEGLPLAAAFRNWSEANFNGRLKTQAYGVDSLRLPLPTGMPPGELIEARDAGDSPAARDTKFAWKADWYIDIDYAQLDNVCNGTAMSVVRSGGRTTPDAATCALIFTGTRDAWWESREQTFVDQLDIDVAQLFAWMGGAGSRRSSLMFVTFHNLPAGLESFTNTRGCVGVTCDFRAFPMVRLKNATILGSPFTIGSNYPVYVMGNYNADPVRWQPAAIFGDAFTWLSTSFTDVNHRDRPATDAIVGGVQRFYRRFDASNGTTTMYAAVLAGHSGTPFDWITPGATPLGCTFSGAGSQPHFYGGGLENFPRFLETWGGGRTALYRGSLVSVSFSQHASNYCAWNGSTYYTPPARDWAFETRFQDPANLPPGTPVVGSVVETAFRPVFE